MVPPKDEFTLMWGEFTPWEIVYVQLSLGYYNYCATIFLEL
jgi:hypothetical protein